MPTSSDESSDEEAYYQEATRRDVPRPHPSESDSLPESAMPDEEVPPDQTPLIRPQEDQAIARENLTQPQFAEGHQEHTNFQQMDITPPPQPPPTANFGPTPRRRQPPSRLTYDYLGDPTFQPIHPNLMQVPAETHHQQHRQYYNSPLHYQPHAPQLIPQTYQMPNPPLHSQPSVYPPNSAGNDPGLWTPSLPVFGAQQNMFPMQSYDDIQPLPREHPPMAPGRSWMTGLRPPVPSF